MTLSEFIAELQAVNDKFSCNKVEFTVNCPGQPSHKYRIADLERVYCVPGSTAGVQLVCRRREGEG